MAAKDLGLPVLGQPPAERADAARSRRMVLAAAREMVAEGGTCALSMDAVAARAGVGVGTVYRRFGDRAGLAFALLDSEEQRFQNAFIHGPPPLGPGAPPVARIRAFLDAYVDRLELEVDIHALAETRAPTARHASGAYQTARAHLVSLLSELQPTGLAADFVAETLLALLGAGFFIHQRRELGRPLEEIKSYLNEVLYRLIAP